MIDTAKPKAATPELDHVRVSQATREMAKPATHEVRTFAQEYDALLIRKKELERQLSLHNDKEAKSEQRRIRANGSNGYTFNEWMKRSAEINEERKKLISEKTIVEQRMLTIRQKAMDEKSLIKVKSNAKATGMEPLAPLLHQVIAELKEIKKLLTN